MSSRPPMGAEAKSETRLRRAPMIEVDARRHIVAQKIWDATREAEKALEEAERLLAKVQEDTEEVLTKARRALTLAKAIGEAGRG